MGTARQALGLYARIWRTYFGWARTLLPLAVFVFVPLGLVHAIPVHLDATDLSPGSGFKIAALLLAFVALGATGLIGEVFYTGAVAIALTHPHRDGPPSLREIAGTVRYGRLIAVDLLYGTLVALGLFAFLVPGVLIYVYLGLAAPAIEIEHLTVRSALSRSLRLVRGHFWLVLVVLLPLELAGDALTDVFTHLCQSSLGDSLVAEWIVDTATNVVFTPFYAVAAVLLTLDLIDAGGERAPRLHSRPARS